MIKLEGYGEQVVEVEEEFFALAEQTYGEFSRWISVQPEFVSLYSDLALVNGILEVEMRLQMVPVEEKRAAYAAARRLSAAAGRAEIVYNWTLVQLFDCVADAWVGQVGEG